MSISFEKDTKHSNVLVADFSASMISTDRHIDLEKVGVKVEHLPPSSRKLLGQDVLPREFIRPYVNLAQEAKAFLGRYGSQTEMGFLISHSRGGDYIEKMEDIKTRWYQQVIIDAQRYVGVASKHVDAIAADPDLEEFPFKAELIQAIKDSQPLWEDVKARLQFDYRITLVGTSGGFDDQMYNKMRDSVVAIKEGAFGTLIKDMCGIARNALEKAIKAESRVHSRTVEAVWDLVEKLDELAFLDPRVRKCEKQFRAEMSKLTRGAALYDGQYDDFITIMMALSNQHIVVAKLDSGEPLFESDEVVVAAPAAVVAPVVSQPAQAEPEEALVAAPVATAPAPVPVIDEVSLDSFGDMDFGSDLEAPQSASVSNDSQDDWALNF